MLFPFRTTAENAIKCRLGLNNFKKGDHPQGDLLFCIRGCMPPRPLLYFGYSESMVEMALLSRDNPGEKVGYLGETSVSGDENGLIGEDLG